jgi:hypothetical protein
MGLTNLVWTKQRIEQLDRLARQRELTASEKSEYERLFMECRGR